MQPRWALDWHVCGVAGAVQVRAGDEGGFMAHCRDLDFLAKCRSKESWTEVV